MTGPMVNGENKRKHLEMIQGVINRMASNSFLFKGWSITIIAGISAFATKDSNRLLMGVPIVSTILFWGIDAYYLMLERSYRDKYSEVLLKNESEIDFDLKTKDVGVRSWLKIAFTRPILWMFYLVVLIMLILLTLELNGNGLRMELNDGS